MEKKKGKEKSEKKTEKDKDLTENLQRLQAEFENYKKRCEKERVEFVKYAKEEIIKNLLPVLDSFEFALKNKCNKEEFAKGVERIFAQLFSVFEQEGVRHIESLGKKFDPYKHEVLLQEKSDKEESIIIEELQKGYMINDRIIRHTKVKVSKK
ncbi:MAG: nucleotide exchange factor GrpE [Candidatus Woesearchaeota archaeon]|jgi:molecular chaperone GrpE|nr:nucleotide exchange factor GrpE [Candidatus Woesearchaeota archaeon]MDP7506046.1 nucleotide exchange factor GrpE [Candidatus Woesearchaeota archaeon]MDP7610520.1 nucleotide exchange factor GrpE [Candidatus Woesearchaeota archaeon]|tara:strand:+ start:2529 stop:2987 length:459 start_codon:yes stop_codon:yes gene_type:complete